MKPEDPTDPRVVEEITKSEYREALKLAAGVVFWADKNIK